MLEIVISALACVLLNEVVAICLGRKEYRSLLKSHRRLKRLEGRIKDELVQIGLISKDYKFFIVRWSNPDAYGYTLPLSFFRRFAVIFTRTGKIRRIHIRTILHEYVHAKTVFVIYDKIQTFLFWFCVVYVGWSVIGLLNVNPAIEFVIAMPVAVGLAFAVFAVLEHVEERIIEHIEGKLIKQYVRSGSTCYQYSKV